jgi:hypothetical protein
MGFYIVRRALSPSSSAYPKGLHRGSPAGLVEVDRDFVAHNIRYNTILFGLNGTMVIWQDEEGESLAVPVPICSLEVIANNGGQSLFDLPLIVPIPAVSCVAENSMEVIDDCEAAWDESVGAGVVVSVDNVDFKVGTGCNLFTVADGAAVGQLAVNGFGPIDARIYAYVKMWLKSSVAIADGELQWQLGATAGCSSPLKELNIGALSANTWTEKTLALGDASSLSSVCSHSIAMDIDKGAFTLRVDQVRFTKGS